MESFYLFNKLMYFEFFSTIGFVKADNGEQKTNIFNDASWNSDRFTKFLKDSWTQIPGAIGEIAGKVKIPKTNIFNDPNWDADRTKKLMAENWQSISTGATKAFDNAVEEWSKKNPVTDAHKVSKREDKPASGDAVEKKPKTNDDDNRPPNVVDFVKYLMTPAGKYHGPMENLSRLWAK